LIGGYDLGISLCVFLEILEVMGLARGTFSELKLRRDLLPDHFSFLMDQVLSGVGFQLGIFPALPT
jgi:hypothetical protein